MLVKKHKIRSSREFKKLYRKAKKLKSSFFVVYFMPSKREYPRFGVVVSRKVSLKAVKRNKLTRQINHILRDELKNFNKSYDIIFIATKKISTAKFAEISKDIDKTIKNLK